MNAPWWAGRTEDHTPPPLRGPGSRRPFGLTWWGRAWIDALENRAELDPNRLPRGRSYARRGTVESLQVTRGVVLARVQGSRATPYAVTVTVRSFDDRQWDRLLDVIAGRLGHTAALLDGELPPKITEDVARVGLDLLPRPGDLRPRCSCPDSADPCKHAAAVCYVLADALDADPFALLHLRGRSRDEVLRELRTRRSAGSGLPGLDAGPRDRPLREPDPGVVAREAFARARGPRPEIPTPPLPPAEPGPPVDIGADPPEESGVASEQLSGLATQAARLAWNGARGGPLRLSFEEDLARWAASDGADAPDGSNGSDAATLARRAKVPARDLAAWAHAWRIAGLAGVRALRAAWDPDPALLADAAAALAAETGQPTRVRRNRVTSGTRQLRLGADGLWYSFTKSFGEWSLAGPPSSEPIADVRRDAT